MFWHNVSKFILKNRLTLLSVSVGLTILMGFQASKVRLSYEPVEILSAEDPNFQLYESFKARYDEDGNILMIGIETNQLFERNIFNGWYDLNQQIKQIEGVKEVISTANLFELVRNDSLKKFDFIPIVARKPTTQAEVDTIEVKISRLPFYQGLIVSEDGRAHLMAITLDQSKLNAKNRIALISEIKEKVLAFEKAHSIEVHLSGLPYIRTEFALKVSQEVILFTILAVIVTGLILLLIFRSFLVMIISLVVVLMGVVWSVGYMVILKYDISLLTGLVPAFTVVICVPNSIFLTNKYHEELRCHDDKMRALAMAAEKIGETAFWANSTISIGFGVFYLTGSKLLAEFGLVASLSVLSTYAIGLILITILYSYLRIPKGMHLSRLEGKRISTFLKKTDYLVNHRRRLIYGTVTVLVVISICGLTQIKAVGYIVDDLPENDPVLTDLNFFEKHFHGVMPFEVNVDSGRPGRALSPQTLTKIHLMQKEVAKHPEFTKPMSLVEAIKFIYQSYRGGDPTYFVLPDALELTKLSEYIGTVKGKEGRFKGFMDSTRRHTRVSFQIADIGTTRTTELYNLLQPKIDSIFNIDSETGKWAEKEERYEVKITGNSIVFTKGNDYLLKILTESTLLAITLISVLMVIFFGNWRMILIAVIAGLIPLIITAGIMGFAGIHLKPSVILIFSMTFGLSSAGTIYFLTKYKHESRTQGRTVAEAISQTIQLAGINMFYTTVVLFADFSIFTASTFKGTVALGILVSITLLMGMLSNLILLPAFLIWMNKKLEQ
jgi:hypothetical protein